MAEQLTSKLIKENFNSSEYVKQKTRDCSSVDDLLGERERIQRLAEETNGLLKKNVYKNYTQFIETAKEISYLEGEMYQLSHMLTEQQSVLNSLLEISVAEPKDLDISPSSKEAEEDNNKNLSLLLEKVEGCATILEVRGRKIIHSGELTELDMSSLKPIGTVYCVLLDDGVMLANKIENSRGPVLYKFQAMYELDGLAIVDVKEDINLKNTFKILMFPEARLFQCSSASVRREWLSQVEEAKKKQLTPYTRIQRLDSESSPEDGDDNPFEKPSSRKMNDTVMPSWLVDMPEELDVCIALREFETAVSYIKKANNHCTSFLGVPAVRDMKIRIDKRAKSLVDILTEELKVSPDHLMQAPRATRKAVGVLIELGKSSRACNLFLKRCSAILKQSLKQQKAEGATVAYVEKLCLVFFPCIAESGKEFVRAFTNSACASSFVVWAKLQLEQFVQIFSKHVFTPQVNSSVAAECVACTHKYCRNLPDVGLDLSFVLDDLLHCQIERLVAETRDKLLEAIKLRANDDKWRPQNHQNAANARKFIDDLKDLGIESPESYLYDDCWISLTANTTAFGKMYLNFLDDLLKLHTTAVHSAINEALVLAFQTQNIHVKNASQNSSNPPDRQFVTRNAAFLQEILNLAEKRYSSKLELAFPQRAELNNELENIITSSNKTSYMKYSSTAYI